MKTDRSPALKGRFDSSDFKRGKKRPLSDICSLMAYVKQFNI
jgi:hypothetical protein